MSGFIGVLTAMSSSTGGGGGGGSGVPNPLADSTIGANGSSVSCSISFNTDGSMTFVNKLTGPTNWYSPTTSGIGSSYYIKFVLNSGGDAWSSGSGIVSGTVYALSSNRSLTWVVTGTNSKAATVTTYIYTDSGGTNLVSTCAINVALN